jgi:hypothetical protein
MNHNLNYLFVYCTFVRAEKSLNAQPSPMRGRYAPLYFHTMINTADFKKQIAKPFGQAMRVYGFKGSGFEYRHETDNYLIVVYIAPSRWGGSCSAGFGIHPKQVDHEYYGKINFERLKTYQYEFRMSLAEDPNGPSWMYSDEEKTNLETLTKIIEIIKSVAFPVIEQFKASPSILELFEVNELRQFHENWTKRTGVYIATTSERFAWATALVLEKKDLMKARQFAQWCLSQSHYDEGEEEWFGDKDLRRILATNNGA